MPNTSTFRQRASHALGVAIEAVLIALVCLSPWAFGSVVPECEFILDFGVALVLLLWGLRMIAMGRLSWRSCPVTFCLAGLFLLGVWQLAPLPRNLLQRVSPGTARFYERLLPGQPELIGPAVPEAEVHAAAGRTISLYPQATRRLLLRILAVVALFAAVRNNLSAADALRRLGIAALVNGALLSLWGLVQFCTSAGNTLYWHILSQGSVFGPFVDRDHFAFYVNLCIGLGLGMLLAMRASRPELREGGFATLLAHPETLWVLSALAVMLSGVIFCLSRGGYVSLLVATVVCVILSLRRSLRSGAIGITALVAAIVVAIVIFFTYDPSMSRLATLWNGEAYQDGRLFVLSSAWPLIKSFPLWGSGYGTFRYVEPLYLHTAQNVGSAYEHAHNEYLEGLIEGGAVRLCLTVLAMALVYRLGLRAVVSQRGKAVAALGLGAVFAFTTMAIHSLGEFGLHIPAITLLATVVAALLCGLNDADGDGRATPVREWRLRGFAPAVGAAICMLLGLLLVVAGWGQTRVESLQSRLAATADDTPLEYQIACLQLALGMVPGDANLHTEIARAHLSLCDEIRNDKSGSSDEQQQALQEHYGSALQHFLLARDLCPLLPVPQVRIAANRDSLSRADDRDAYLERAKFLAPVDPQLWYLCGLLELSEGREDAAWSSWRRSLSLSDRFLARIVDQSAARLGGEGMLQELVPDDPAVLSSVALHAYPRPENAASQRPFFEKALALLEARGNSLSAEESCLKASLCVRLNKPAEAIEAWQAALALRPLETGWRYELAQLLYEQQRNQEAIRELRFVLDREPSHPAAQQLAAVMAREAAEGKLHTSP
jgi:O-antigen ligase